MGYRVRDFTGDMMSGLKGFSQVGDAINDKRKMDLLAKEGASRIKESEQQQKLNQQKIDANKSTADQEAAARQITSETEARGAMTPAALEGTKTATGNAVNMDEIKSAKQADSDAKLYNMLNQGKEGFMPLNGRALRKMADAKALDANKADQAEIKKEEAAGAKESRAAAESTAGIAETKARTGLLGAQTLKAREATTKEPAAKETRLTEAQSKTLGAAGMAKTMLDDLANQFKGSKLGGMKGFAADMVESVPVVGGKMAPETNAYNDKRRITAETFLREATGAAAPAAEIKFYTNLLPEPGDSEEQAQSSLDAFRGAVMAKVNGVAATLRAQGKDAQADEIESKMKTLFSTSANIKEPAGNKIGRFVVEEG